MDELNANISKYYSMDHNPGKRESYSFDELFPHNCVSWALKSSMDELNIKIAKHLSMYLNQRNSIEGNALWWVLEDHAIDELQ
jgi:Tfp pilus assembly PilM family ATPase